MKPTRPGIGVKLLTMHEGKTHILEVDLLTTYG